MGTKKILFWFIIVILIILGYNYFLAPFLIQQSGNTEMGMHMGMNVRVNNYNPYNQFYQILILLVVIFILIGSILLYYSIIRQSRNSCTKCGSTIENERWNVCPVCGTRIKKK